jgi:hypothetical protein
MIIFLSIHQYISNQYIQIVPSLSSNSIPVFSSASMPVDITIGNDESGSEGERDRATMILDGNVSESDSESAVRIQMLADASQAFQNKKGAVNIYLNLHIFLI